MLFQRDERRVIISFQKGETKSNIITERLEWYKACREFERAMCNTWLFKKTRGVCSVLEKRIAPKGYN